MLLCGVTKTFAFKGVQTIHQPHLKRREDGSAVCNAITEWSESLRTHNHTLLSHLGLPQPGGPGTRIYIPQEQGGPDLRLGTGSPLRRLLRLTGLRWRYSNPPPHVKDSIHHPVFYLKLSSTLYDCPYNTGNTLRLRYKTNRLMLWYITMVY
jgi:hypothetical protein